MTTRRDDETLLLALALRDDGLTWPQIAKALGGTVSKWKAAARRVQTDYRASVRA